VVPVALGIALPDVPAGGGTGLDVGGVAVGAAALGGALTGEALVGGALGTALGGTAALVADGG